MKKVKVWGRSEEYAVVNGPKLYELMKAAGYKTFWSFNRLFIEDGFSDNYIRWVIYSCRAKENRIRLICKKLGVDVSEVTYPDDCDIEQTPYGKQLYGKQKKTAKASHQKLAEYLAKFSPHQLIKIGTNHGSTWRFAGQVGKLDIDALDDQMFIAVAKAVQTTYSASAHQRRQKQLAEYVRLAERDVIEIYPSIVESDVLCIVIEGVESGSVWYVRQGKMLKQSELTARA